MKDIVKKDTHILVFETGEELCVLLQEYCSKNGIEAAWFSAIGACQEVTLSFYDLAEKKYRDIEIKENLEIAGITGNIALLNGKPIVHVHGLFSGKDLATRSGHVKRLVVSATCEVFLMKLENSMERAHDDATGLNLLNPHDKSNISN